MEIQKKENYKKYSVQLKMTFLNSNILELAENVLQYLRIILQHIASR